MSNFDDCRIYVCKSVFGQYDDCIKFNNLSEYEDWLHNSGENTPYTFQPICNKREIFDRLVLMTRSSRILPVVTISKNE